MRTSFVTSAADAGGFPPRDRAEFAFFGRSNVGKSTLLNRLAGARIARVSRTPGRTQLVNFFDVDSPTVAFRLADLPGYGFAAAPQSVSRTFESLVLGYLGAHRMTAGLLLLDVRREPSDEDVQACELLKESLAAAAGGELWIIVTKGDKVPKARRKPVVHRVARRLNVDVQTVSLTSASEGWGIEDLRERLVARST